MKSALALLITILFVLHSKAQDNLSFAVKNIADSLRNEATSVYRIDETIVDVTSISEYSYTKHQAYTILNKRGLKYFQYVILPSDKFSRIDDIEVKIFDSLGIEIKKYKRKDFAVIGSPLNDALVSDDKSYVLEISPKEFPCTIETNFRIKAKGYIDFPDWKAASFFGAFEKSSYRISIPQKLGLRYKAYNTSIKPSITPNGEFTSFEWAVSGVKEVNEESGSYSWWAYFPMVAIAPNAFEYDDRKGSFETWKDYGIWNFDFYNEKEPFTTIEAEKIKAAVSVLKNPVEKISYLYKKMQQETRYVSIQLGIGGLKPFPAKFVHEKKYGDCKALSNYMKQQLQVIGIKSYAAIIKSGANSYPADPSFPNEGFDHVILCVPLEKDTMWLECTSQLTQPGVLGTFTENRNAILVTENGGVLVNTPKSKSSNNVWIAKTLTQLFEDGGSLMESTIFVTGEFSEMIYYLLKNKSKDEIKKALINYLDFKNPDDFEFAMLGDSANGQNINIKLAYSKFYDVKTSSKYFMAQKEYRISNVDIPIDENRKTDFLFPFPFIKTDSVIYLLPSIFKIESIPTAKLILNDYATYKNSITYNGAASTISVYTSLQINKHIIPVLKYKEIASLFLQMKKDEDQKIVLKKE